MIAYLAGGQLIASVVPRIIRMAFYFDDCNLVRLHDGQQPFPKILVFNGFFRGSFPTIALPTVNPVLLKCVNQICGIRIQRYGTRLLERRKSLNSSKKFHAIVGRIRHKTRNFFFVFTKHEHGSPAAGAWIT